MTVLCSKMTNITPRSGLVEMDSTRIPHGRELSGKFAHGLKLVETSKALASIRAYPAEVPVVCYQEHEGGPRKLPVWYPRTCLVRSNSSDIDTLAKVNSQPETQQEKQN